MIINGLLLWLLTIYLVGGLEHGWIIFPKSWDDDPI
jgi:hypothetical protein